MNRPIIIAEAGVNHNGSPETAVKMVRAAAAAGADYIKFQTFKTESLVTAACEAAAYQKENCNADSQTEMLKKLELGFEDFRFLKEVCAKEGIGFLSTPFDRESILFLAALKPDFMKVPSGEITNLPYLREIAATNIPVIISTGMSTLEDISAALQPFKDAGYENEKIILLHCTTQYPTPYEDVNLRVMTALSKTFGLRTGYSDHTRGIEVPLAAAALGAAVIEKHFTLSRNMEGPDHKASLEPDELCDMVKGIKNVAKALGKNKKEVAASESANMIIARRSIVASRPIEKGEILSETNITCKRPANGISPMNWDTLIGKKSPRRFLADEPFLSNDLESLTGNH